MIDHLILLAFAAALLFSILFDRSGETVTAILQCGEEALSLGAVLCGSMMLWKGFFKVAEASGVVTKFSSGLSPFLKWLFPGIEKEKNVFSPLSLNVSANLLGLGNAATPFGIEAMRQLARSMKGYTATDCMIRLVVLNTASIQLIPTTVSALRAQYGSAAPLEILPAVWCASFCSAAAGILCCALLERRCR